MVINAPKFRGHSMQDFESLAVIVTIALKGGVQIQLNILSVLECNVCMFLLMFLAVYCFYYYYVFTMDASI